LKKPTLVAGTDLVEGKGVWEILLSPAAEGKRTFLYFYKTWLS